MIELFRVAKQIQDLCERNQWEFCIIGGVALQRWGEPRLTQDIDLSLLTGFGNEESFIRILLAHFPSRIANAEEFALRNRVLLLQSETGIGIDIALGGFDFEQFMVRRASMYEFLPGITLLTRHVQLFEMSLPQGILPTPCPSQEGNARHCRTVNSPPGRGKGWVCHS